MESDLLELLEPLGDTFACGDDLSFSPEFDRIHEARREDDSTVDYGEWKTELKQADWQEVVASCKDLLRTRSKDLRLAAWLAEGMLKTVGLAGMGAATVLFAGLLERYGDDIHPRSEGDDQEQRIGTVAWFVMRLAQLVRQVPLTSAKAGRDRDGEFSLNDYDAARHLQVQMARNADTVGGLEGKTTLDMISLAITKTDKELYRQWIADAARCQAATRELARVSDLRFGTDGPSFSSLTDSVAAVHECLLAIGREHGILPESQRTDTPESMEPVSRPAASTATDALRGTIHDREQALECLRQVATFFRHTEPHSPVAYLADKAIQWGRMPLHAWLRSVVKDHGTLSQLEELLGMHVDDGARRHEG